MNRKLISEAIGGIDDKLISEAVCYAPKSVYSDAVLRPQKRRRPMMAAAIAACLILTMSIAGCATYQLFMSYREAEPEEQFYPALAQPGANKLKMAWTDAKLVFSFEEPAACNMIRFKPGWLPSEPGVGGNAQEQDREGWYTRLDGSDGRAQPYLIETYYASQFVDEGNMILLYYTPGDITEESWGDYQILKFEASMKPWGDFASERTVERSYYIMFHQTMGHIIVISGEDTDTATLERIGQSLEIDVTEDIISAADYHEYDVFMDGGKG